MKLVIDSFCFLANVTKSSRTINYEYSWVTGNYLPVKYNKRSKHR